MATAALLAPAACGVTSLQSAGSVEKASRLALEISADVGARLERLARGGPWRVADARYQTTQGGRALWTVTLAAGDPKVYEAGIESANPAVIQALRLYRDGIEPDLPRMKGTHLYLLAFDDPQQILIEFEPAEVEAYVKGDLDDSAFLRAASIMRRAPAPSPP